MRNKYFRGCQNGYIKTLCRPILIGLLAAVATMVVIIALFSLFFVIIESIAQSAIVPMSLLAAALGCFIGAYICTSVTKCRGLVFGAIVGFCVFVVIWLISLVGGGLFGTRTAIKFLLLIFSGCIGGYLGCNSKRK